jgi:hypothetical protein
MVLHHINMRCENYEEWNIDELMPMSKHDHRILHTRNITDETRRKLSEASKGNTYTKGRKLSEEHRKKVIDKLRGRPVSAETRKKISASLMGHSMSESSRQSLLKANKGRALSDEHKKKISLAGNGRVFSMESRAKISEARKAHNGWTQTEIDTLMEYRNLSSRELSNMLNRTKTAINIKRSRLKKGD